MADDLITDYSAVVFDAAVLGVPTYSYAYDLDDYVQRRGLVLDYAHDMPGPPFHDAAELVAALLAGLVTAEDVARFRDEFISAADGGSTRRIVQLALGAAPAAIV